MQKYFAVLLLIAVILGFFTIRDFLNTSSNNHSSDIDETYSRNQNVSNTADVTIKNILVRAEVAKTPEQKELGLSFRNSLNKNSGMLFIFNPYQKPFFWMKDMNFPLDIIWIKDDKIIDISRNLPTPKPGTQINQLTKYSPSDLVNYVLEVNAGFTDQNKIKTGDTVSIKF